MANKGLPIFGIAVIAFLMGGGATFTGIPPLEAAHAQTPEFNCPYHEQR